VILAVNGQAVNMQSAEKLLRPLVEPKSAEPMRVKFRSGTGPEQERQATPREFDVEVKNLVEAIPTPTPTQQALQDGLLKG
jgi:hypothetical protein